MMSSTSGSVFIFKAFYNMTWFRERARSSESSILIGYSSGRPVIPAVARKKKFSFDQEINPSSLAWVPDTNAKILQ